MGDDKILIVDDVSRNIQVLANILSMENFQIAYAQSGKQALEVCKVQKFDLILLDIMMPEMDGYEVCKILKANPETADIPIIFLTARADMDSIVKGFDYGIQDYITKPFNAAELLARVNTHLTIKNQKAQLVHMNNNLEKMVSDRTRDLETANEKLSILDKAKSNFLSLISHEIRTPLNGVMGITELLYNTKLTIYQKEQLDSLKEVSSRLLNFSNTALLITTLKTYNHYASMLPTPIRVLVEDSISRFNYEYPESHLQINVNMKDEGVKVNVDNTLISKCFYMIMQNVCRFAGDDSIVDITTQLNTENVSVLFTDNGPGFSESALNNIFEVFSTGDVLHNEGSGLGLAASKVIIDAHEGDIIARNNENGGAEIVVSFKL